MDQQNGCGSSNRFFFSLLPFFYWKFIADHIDMDSFFLPHPVRCAIHKMKYFLLTCFSSSFLLLVWFDDKMIKLNERWDINIKKVRKFPFDAHLSCDDKTVIRCVSWINLFRGCEYYENWYCFYCQEVCVNFYLK